MDEGLICYSVLGKGRSKQRPYNFVSSHAGCLLMKRHGFIAAIEQYRFKFIARHGSQISSKNFAEM
ncbi:MAG: hypothetical protein WAK91_02725, partial [Candidatus Acidiferrales bacterium]